MQVTVPDDMNKIHLLQDSRPKHIVVQGAKGANSKKSTSTVKSVWVGQGAANGHGWDRKEGDATSVGDVDRLAVNKCGDLAVLVEHLAFGKQSIEVLHRFFSVVNTKPLDVVVGVSLDPRFD